MGSAAADQLARDGRSVLLLEQYEIGHARGDVFWRTGNAGKHPLPERPLLSQTLPLEQIPS